ncbi:unnamed protein product [Caenorhabditis auriculariae]|uniref:Transposase Tc1-like domain-containing protein n=1 Tax=Caenorhabditis auriculariae TaxID=2777116 RepID=A0A8S1HE55_9PELO|nr:unnamed protein product [Caenorhabditis auriculariae]
MSIGIDLGTTFSCVGHYENGVVKILENENGCRTTPSVLAIDEDGEWLIGQHAKDFVTNPDNCVFDVKRIIGRRFNDVLLQKDMLLWPFRIEKDGVDPVLVLRSGSKTHKFSPVSISAHILRKLKENAERKLGIPVKEAVITVPAYFNASQRRATQEAGSLAGLNVLRILNEPTAAAIAYSLHGGQRLSKRNILIYDLGGGTFDVAVVSIDGPRITVKAKGGDTHLGGEDIDNRLIRALADRFQAEHGIDLMKSFRAMKRLRKAAENAKITLSSSNNARIEMALLTANALEDHVSLIVMTIGTFLKTSRTNQDSPPLRSDGKFFLNSPSPPSVSTVKRRLNAAGIMGRRPVKKPLISEKNRAARVKWAKEHLNWTRQDWNKILSSDEIKFLLFGSDGIQ